ncbi:MAG: hypothetical protein HUJ65_02415 [Oscillospiraceae bacterium]|nr:hypothetical protein [Oscillospiraceae bacterium]
MKTKKQIKAYLELQPWFDDFKANVEKYAESTTRDPQEILNGEMGEYTISAPFPWSITKQGADYWRNVDNAFCDWFYDRNK